MQEMNLEVTSEFIIMASKLIYLKSKTLLPMDEDEEEEEIDLVQMLLEYKKYKETTKGMKERLEEYGQKFYRQPEKVELPKGKLEKTYSSMFIPDTYATIINREIEKKNKNADNLEKIAVSEKVTIRSKIKEILKQLWNKPTFIFNKIFNSKKQTKTEVVTAFLGLLELSRMNKVEISQKALFGDIQVTKIKKNQQNEMADN
jgi:segregation and condensation protein A